MKFTERVQRHVRITKQNYEELPSPPFLVLFINSICNMKCDHCFYWRSLNQKDDLTYEELVALSESLGKIENLNLSGGEPFIRKEFADICRQFIRHNGVRQIYVPTNGYFTKWTVEKISEILDNEPELELFVAEISLDGMPDFHDEFRVAKNAFKKAMETYDALAELQNRDPRVRIHCISTATHINMDEIRKLTTYLYERCPQMDHHNLAIIRGDRKDPSLEGPALEKYEELYEYIQRLWAPREEGRYGSIVEPLLQWGKVETIKQKRQVVPCRAGKLSAVVYANGDVGVCEIHKPLGNLREKSFWEIWKSAEADALRKSIEAKECYCTTEVFMWSSIVHQPVQLVRAVGASKAWRRPVPLGEGERVPIELGPDRLPLSTNGNGKPHGDDEPASPADPDELVQLEPASE
ncbi:MAG: radical SAM protein [Gemmatimonadota bacterium]|nr:radical SAM protein [Gemmatimonadota bacterium]